MNFTDFLTLLELDSVLRKYSISEMFLENNKNMNFKIHLFISYFHFFQHYRGIKDK
jgi:hypothetical protein